MSELIRVLLVEDSPGDANLIQELLAGDAHRTFEVKCTPRLMTAIDLVDASHFDIILLDLGLPDSSGLDTIRCMCEHSVNLPIVVMTGNDDEKTGLAAIQAGAEDYLVKGQVAADLLKRILQYSLERHQNAAKLRESEARYRTLTENALDIILMLDRNGHIQFANVAAIRVFGRRSEELIGQAYATMFQSPSSKNQQDGLQQVFETGQPLVEDSTALFATGERWLSTQWVPLRNPSGEISTVMGISRDITARKQAEEQIRHQALVLENLSDAVVASDAQYNLTAWNAAAETLYGWKENEVLGRNEVDLIKTEWPEADAERMRHTIAERGQWRGEATQVRKDGTRFPVEVSSITLRGDNGNISGYVSVNHDISQRKTGERVIRMRTEDLALVNTLNTEVNGGADIDRLADVLATEIDELIPGCRGVIVRLLDLNATHLEMRRATLSTPLTHQIEKLLGLQLPTVNIPVEKDTFFQKILETGQGMLLNEPTIIRQWLAVFAETTFLSPLPRAGIIKILPQLHALLNIQTVIIIPLVAAGRAIGLMDVTSSSLLTLDDLTRIQNIGNHVTEVILRRQAEETIHRQLDYLGALREIDRAISSSFDTAMCLNAVLSRAMSLLKMDAGAVLFFDSSSIYLEYAVALGFRTMAVERTEVRLEESYAGKAILANRLIEIPDLFREAEKLFPDAFLRNEGFVSYCGTPLVVKGRIIGVLEAFQRTVVKHDQEWLNFFETLAGQAAIAIDNTQLFTSLQSTNIELRLAYDTTIEGWSHALDLRDKETEGHSVRVTEKTIWLAKEMGISDQELVHIRRGALLHDIGKMGVPDSILLKPGKLNDEEMKIMKLHPQFAYDMLSQILYLKPALDIPWCHHEKWDGTGYPRGLLGEQIPHAARIFAIVDVYDALVSERPYRKAWPQEKALEYIRSLAGTHFDPRVVEAFFKFAGQKGWSFDG